MSSMTKSKWHIMGFSHRHGKIVDEAAVMKEKGIASRIKHAENVKKGNMTRECRSITSEMLLPHWRCQCGGRSLAKSHGLYKA
jgi:hypothetical protein